jgi:hypothetical protein
LTPPLIMPRTFWLTSQYSTLIFPPSFFSYQSVHCRNYYCRIRNLMTILELI